MATMKYKPTTPSRRNMVSPSFDEVTKFTPEKKKPTFLFTQLDSVDGAGHAHGYGSEKHLQQIHIADEMLGQAYQAVCDAGIQDDTLFMMIADHGGKGCGHGGWSDSEKLTTFACVGPTVQRCDIEEMNIRDLAAITLYALGIEAPRVQRDRLDVAGSRGYLRRRYPAGIP